ncbi:MAG: ABC transporter ATP-binding protein [Acidimicrobiia bacterium]|nr:ABC transporter ATP-binding protein [Acidimicrobiia bacterium]
MSAVIEVWDLSVHFRTTLGVVRAVEGLSFAIGEGETMAIVGESGSGKSTVAHALLRLVPDPPGKIVAGHVRFEDQNLLDLSDAAIRHVRGRRIAMIFQDAMAALNPVFTVERQIGEVLRLHLGLAPDRIAAEVVELLRLVGVPAPEARARQYPHNLSGGMRQRVMIAMALACRPKLLIADEPTTALDVTVQAQVLDLIQSLKARFGMAVLLITHDLGVVAETAHRVIVMYAGRKVEEGAVTDIFADPRHPYTRGLLEAAKREETEGAFLREIPGTVPSPFEMPKGCSFAPRCPDAFDRCRMEMPELRDVAPGRPVACFAAQGASR